uniref:Uncharacterized protein n=1 Tax=Esox lucius TaxID=8010 RepID=A0AAY5L3R8_ESOLU
MTVVIAYEKETSVTDSPEKKNDLEETEEEQVCLEADSMESIEKKALLDIIADLPASMIDELDNLGNGLCTGNPFQQETLSGHEELNRNESITSSISDTPSSEYPHTQFSPCSEDSGLGDSSYRSPYEEFPETPMEREVRLAMEKDDNFRRDRGFPNGMKPTECPQTSTRPVIFLPAKLCQDVDEKRKTYDKPEGSPRHGTKDTARANEWHSDEKSSANVIILETSNLIIRSASEFCLTTLRSRSQMSLVDEEIKMVKQREEELKRERASIYTKGRYNATGLAGEKLMDSLSFEGKSI